MARTLLCTLVAGAFLVSGCGASESSDTEFRGAEGDVADVVEELQSAGRSKDAAKICGEIFSQALAEQLKTGNADCVDEIGDAIDDTDDFELEVRDVTVTGNRATAVVQQGDDRRKTATFQFARERDGWRATSLG